MRPLKQIVPTLIINPLVYNKMRALVDTTNKELAWHGFTKRLNDHTYYWYDIIVYPQYVTGATVDPDEDEYSEWIAKQMAYDNFEDMRLHGHSHVNMACSPSGTDKNYRENLLTKVKDYYIFIIANKSKDYTIEIYDIDLGFCFGSEDVEVIIGTENNLSEAITWSQKVISNNIKERSYPCSTILNQRNFSTQRNSTMIYTSSDAEPSVDPLQNSWQDLV